MRASQAGPGRGGLPGRFVLALVAMPVVLGSGAALAADLLLRGGETHIVDSTTEVYVTVKVPQPNTGGLLATLEIINRGVLQATGSMTIGEAAFSDSNGLVRVVGPGSRLDVGGSLTIADRSFGSESVMGTLRIEDGGFVRVSQGLFVVPPDSSAFPIAGTVILTGPSSTLEAGGITLGPQVAGQLAARFTIGSGAAAFTQSLSLDRGSAFDVGEGGELHVDQSFSTNAGATLNLIGGTLYLPNPGLITAGGLNRTGGGFHFRDDLLLDGGPGLITDEFGAPIDLTGGTGSGPDVLGTDGVATLSTGLALNGGRFASASMAVAPGGSLAFNSGELILTGRGRVLELTPLAVGDGGQKSAVLKLNGVGDTTFSDLSLASNGRLVFTGGTLRVGSLTNAGGRLTVAHGSVNIAEVLSNQGDLALVDAVVDGAVSSPAGSAVNVVGTATFNGPFSGAAGFFGSGTAVFNGGVSPGDSPAIIPVEGGIAFGPPSTLTIELGAPTLGQYDRFEIQGDLQAGGSLVVSLLPGFTGAEGDRYEIFAAASITGDFAYTPPGVGPGLLLDLSRTAGSIALTVVADCNANGVADSREIEQGSASDCNGNAVPDECDLAGGAPDTNANGYLDACEVSLLTVTNAELSWTSLAIAFAYDVVRGDLATLRSSGGDFAAATDGCLVEDAAGTVLPYTVEPAAGTGIWILVRGVAASAALSYDTFSPSQTGARDAEIAASAVACP